MKKLRSFVPYALILSAVVMFMVSCSKDGEPGPAGAQGPAGTNGTQGPAGPKGDTGAKGDTGVANVIYSAWLDVPFAADTVQYPGGVIDTVGWYGQIAVAKLTADMIGKSDVKVYINMNTPASPQVLALPFYGSFSLFNLLVPGGIILQSNVRIGTVSVNGTKYQQYRYILIPGGVAARSVIDWNNYEAVKAYLNLVD
ncbi:collagen-like protein [Chitinophaga sp. sic0106]|uniref:collagen-like protein n=1 Tax=Chitinophaga sp. sic0106 TaxID=2854785 RepID=UPI001C4871E8|nr:collagen-like protein [Chitinophaga sp. sic0106]MBV7530286.1 collagen-like protein [Chitinophaga sp. sic0106]